MESVEKVDKPWGYELIWARTDKYIGKIIHINDGHRLSLQYHNEKEETIFVMSGQLMIWESEGPDISCQAKTSSQVRCYKKSRLHAIRG